jgi:hypothetical protein
MGIVMCGPVKGEKNTFGRCLRFVITIMPHLLNCLKIEIFLAEVVDMVNFEMQTTSVSSVKLASIKILTTTTIQSQTGKHSARNAQQVIMRPKF